ncbi:hypothetical protein D9619_009432 [Psilocybe cf. subviscida]|uniref:Integrase catalytic domain-containing protein n=1 Tax=Psilocybe cf. subviscida TaxID=2480587 RepID=A0A8H5BVI0_9AGAR|nr:hypothetical protein D9619_009432 [Psilocybe cf. subviscida]
MMLFTNHYGCKRDTYFIANKDAATTLACLRHYKLKSELQTGKMLVAMITNNGGEFANGLWEEFCEQHGIEHKFTTAYSSAANGIGERGNRIVLGMARTMIRNTGLAGLIWAEACATAIYILDRIPCAANNDIPPVQSWDPENKKPDVSHLRPFGCVAHLG